MSENAIATIDLGLGDLNLDASSAAAKVPANTGGGYLPNLRFYKNAPDGPEGYEDVIKNKTMGFIYKGKAICLGSKADFIVLARRDKAVDTSSKPVRQSFDGDSELFAEIAELADSGTTRGKAMWGPDLLLLDLASYELITLFGHNKTMRGDLAALKKYVGSSEPVTIGYRIAENADGDKWAGAEISESSAVIDPERLPEDLKAQVVKFLSVNDA